MKTHKDLLVLKAGKTLVHARGYLATTHQPTTRNRAQATEVVNLSGEKKKNPTFKGKWIRKLVEARTSIASPSKL